MHVVVFFINIGFYHAARLSAASAELNRRGWKLTAVQLTDNTLEHPWGNLDKTLPFPLLTLLPQAKANSERFYIPKVSRNTIETCLASLKPDVVFLPGWSFRLSITAMRWCRKKHIPLVVMSDSKRDDKQRYRLKEKLKSIFLIRKFSAALVAGKIHADYISSLGLSHDRIFTGYDTVDNDHFLHHADFARKNGDVVRSRYPAIPQRPYFFSATRLIPRKNIKRLIEAYARYRKEAPAPPWDLVICGHGNQQEQLKKYVSGLEINDPVHFPGFLPYHEIGFWYGLAEAFIHPALHEQWGLVVNEACAAGLPILCSKTVGARYDLVKEGENGFLFDPEDVEDIKQCLLRMHVTNPERRQLMGEASRLIVQLHSPESFANGFVSAASMALKGK